MADNLIIAVVGNRNSGKSKTWNTLFKSTVKTGSELRHLYLNAAQWVDNVFLVSGSPEERDIAIEDLMPKESPSIVLCSVQYRTGMENTFDYFFNQGYDVFVQWLNPGYSDEASYADNLNIVSWLLDKGAILSKRNGTHSPENRVEEIRQHILGWAKYRDLLRTEF